MPFVKGIKHNPSSREGLPLDAAKVSRVHPITNNVLFFPPQADCSFSVSSETEKVNESSKSCSSCLRILETMPLVFRRLVFLEQLLSSIFKTDRHGKQYPQYLSI